ncbi:hypothetical protein [Halomarina oriensis]|uniref:Uncharacterized protein n=1 Tax=Halomarina oriensis TaxID=671145 RepID=A0A6B0GLM3_9EURY|nr:hypothetical protein [Halomarina oriensis]MWG33673.1 hypothetical protein [Halomarina oriensis]
MNGHVVAFVGPLRPYVGVLLPLFFVGFFVAAGVAIYYRQNATVRRTYVVNFFVALVLVNLVLSVVVVPFFHWHKFSIARSAEESYHTMRIVDERGCEIRVDGEVPFEAENIALQPLLNEMYAEYSAEKRRTVALYLLDESREFRRQVEADSPSKYLRYPAHGFTTWPREKVERYDRFVAVRVYRVNLTTNAAGTEVESYSERRVDEWQESGPAVPATRPANCPPVATSEVAG